MRITENLILKHSMDHLIESRSRLYDMQTQIATQKRVTRPGDDPFAAERAVGVRSALRANESYRKSIGLCLGWLGVTEAALLEVKEAVIKANTLTLRASDDALGEDERAAIKNQVEGIFKQAITAANSQHQGRYVFGGYQTNAEPFTLDDVTFAWTYNGDAGQIERATQPGQTLQINLLGDQVFQDAFDALEALITTLGIPGVTGDTINDHIDDLELALDALLENLGTVGTRTVRLQATEYRLIDLDVRLQEELSKLEDADMAEAAMLLASHEIAYQAMVQVASRLDQPLLIELIR